jgi:prepilin-type N-terminal cleavage/methylation domain-containing protein
VEEENLKKAFTLIELLVVIAIIAILAAILFPVFAQAKTAAKKATSISNLKQIGTSVALYMGDSDDIYPRNDDCVAGSSLNTVHNSLPYNATGAGCTGPFYYRRNHYSWQKWLMPYAKSVDVFMHPAMKKDPTQWADGGEIMNGYAINLSLTGALNTWNRPATSNGSFRDSFLGGSQSNIPDVGSAMLFMELASTIINFVPVFTTPNAATQTAYPAAVRELWVPMFMKRVGTSGCTYSNDVDASLYPFSGSIVIAKTDTSAKAIPIRQFLANTPTAAEYSVSSRWPCAPDGGAWTISAAPVYTKSWPMWAIEK